MAFSRGRSTETRLIYLGLFLLLAAGFATSLSPTAAFWGNAFLAAVLAAGGLWVVVALVRRERRIRRRLDAISNQPGQVRHWRDPRPDPHGETTDTRAA
ncbi:hypothetical protein ACL02T_21985 [Pseudonocardia sp. RS010]|uniref:hypothetical protein n=1 Tax=Pseudonocardia sp. RS010 TaxID=3385979 RepID=UPI0039A27961